MKCVFDRRTSLSWKESFQKWTNTRFRGNGKWAKADQTHLSPFSHCFFFLFFFINTAKCDLKKSARQKGGGGGNRSSFSPHFIHVLMESTSYKKAIHKKAGKYHQSKDACKLRSMSSSYNANITLSSYYWEQNINKYMYSVHRKNLLTKDNKVFKGC